MLECSLVPKRHENEAEQREERDEGFGDAASRNAEHSGIVLTRGMATEITGEANSTARRSSEAGFNKIRQPFQKDGGRPMGRDGEWRECAIGCYSRDALRQI